MIGACSRKMQRLLMISNVETIMQHSEENTPACLSVPLSFVFYYVPNPSGTVALPHTPAFCFLCVMFLTGLFLIMYFSPIS